MNKRKARQILMWVIAADFPLLYTGTVTFESTAVTLVALAVMGAAAAIAALVY